jgi:hypothetical protein
MSPTATPSAPRSVAAPRSFDLPRTSARSEQLVAASSKTTLDPFRDVDWSVPVDDRAYHLPPELLPLYGTAPWDAMTEAERIAYSRHETVALLGAGIWFENALMQIVLKHLLDIPVTDPAHRYLLVEIADECRHSTMFGEYMRRAGTPVYGPTQPVELDDTSSGRALSYLLILAVEELLDFMNRSTMRDERVHPVSRQIAKLHVLEEARHVSFAKTYLSEVWPALDPADRRVVIDTAPALVAAIVELSLDGAVYHELAIVDGLETARNNPHYRATVVAGLAKLTGFLADLGIIDGPSRPNWGAMGLIAADPAT